MNCSKCNKPIECAHCIDKKWEQDIQRLDRPTKRTQIKASIGKLPNKIVDIQTQYGNKLYVADVNYKWIDVSNEPLFDVYDTQLSPDNRIYMNNADLKK